MKIIVDLFTQHSGDLEELKRMALCAYLAGADSVKLQLFDAKTHWDESRQYLEMTYEQTEEIVNYCRNLGIHIFATIFEEEKLEWLDSLSFDAYKISSVTAFKKKELCEKILLKGKETMISTGMHPTGEEFPFGHDKNIKYLYCIAEYPTLISNNKIKEMPVFSDDGYYGYSDHVIGISASLKSYFQGAKVLEKHFTFNTNMQNDKEKAHLGSFTPETLRQFKNLIRELDIING